MSYGFELYTSSSQLFYSANDSGYLFLILDTFTLNMNQSTVKDYSGYNIGPTSQISVLEMNNASYCHSVSVASGVVTITSQTSTNTTPCYFVVGYS